MITKQCRRLICSRRCGYLSCAGQDGTAQGVRRGSGGGQEGVRRAPLARGAPFCFQAVPRPPLGCATTTCSTSSWTCLAGKHCHAHTHDIVTTPGQPFSLASNIRPDSRFR
eukprot:432784-Prorocentrum_minimum.AAC.1